ncbi:hypothetical protein BJ138DRAFT_1208604 [Hygrophoropsis aurantiaca]|uniref:Uncharacterized protein n=1 Tax=Hygrophoropsis aurantiaca TaxID=72124 RepID=A0ACB8ANY4_9AGAM|nr:hypothetical protein BJ138DRAFT_1208604 [Hygrophoropsis aurantiaca]
MTSTVAFPSELMSSEYHHHLSEAHSQISTDKQINLPSVVRDKSIDMSVVSRHATALEVCDFVYGNSSSPKFLNAVELFYEDHASVYENPFVTATSRSVISDIYTLTRQLSVVDMPKPLAMLHTLLRLRSPDSEANSKWFRTLQVWSEVGEISESESFDGHKKSIVEHTLNILFFPGLHLGSFGARPFYTSTSASNTPISFPSPNSTPPTEHPFAPPSPQSLHLSLYGQSLTDPSLPIPYTPLTIRSPLHFQLHILTRLSFNEQGRITHHRDIWDVKDIIGLIPGMGLAQWVGGRIAARGLAWFGRTVMNHSRGSKDKEPTLNQDHITIDDKEAEEHHAENQKQLVVSPLEKPLAIPYMDWLRKHGLARSANEEV